jgi:hypothetical protein
MIRPRPAVRRATRSLAYSEGSTNVCVGTPPILNTSSRRTCSTEWPAISGVGSVVKGELRRVAPARDGRGTAEARLGRRRVYADESHSSSSKGSTSTSQGPASTDHLQAACRRTRTRAAGGRGRGTWSRAVATIATLSVALARRLARRGRARAQNRLVEGLRSYSQTACKASLGLGDRMGRGRNAAGTRGSCP